jgi:hypothetical protein
MSKWKDWRLNALTESSGDDENQDNNYITISESFYHLNSEAKLGFSIRQMRKHLTEIEKQFKRTVESGRTDESLVESWVRTYESLSQLDERLHGLLKSMYKKRK